MSLIKCKECGQEISSSVKKCPHCGYKEKKGIKVNKKAFIIGLICIIVLMIIGVLVYNKNIEKQKKEEQERYDNLPIKVDISMTSYYGTIEYILYELGLDFDLVTSGATCLTGIQKNEFKTKKYGVLHTEFRYCKYNKSQSLRIYNDEKDQELRDPKPGELPEFDSFGYRKNKNDSV